MIRTLVVSFLLALGALASPLGRAQAAQPETVVLEVPGMTCRTCPITVRLALERVPGVIDAEADFDTKTATVTFDPDQTDARALIRATTEAGYPSTVRTSRPGE